MPTSLQWLEEVPRMSSLEVDVCGTNIETDKFLFEHVILHWWKDNTSLMLTDILHK